MAQSTNIHSLDKINISNLLTSHPGNFQEYLFRSGVLDSVYKSITNPDYGATVVTLLALLKKVPNMPDSFKETKCELRACNYRNKGNIAFQHKHYQLALTAYNEALAHAPKDTDAMKFAYSNRSALLCTMGLFTACIHDINKCISLGCPDSIKEKLALRKSQAQSKRYFEKVPLSPEYAKQFFQFNKTRNTAIPCATLDIDISTENIIPKVLANTDIKVGAVVAVETPFVSQAEIKNTHATCYYCHKLSMNLQPCGNCCHAMFCNAQCEQKCLEEYHNIECQIMGLCYDYLECSSATRLAVKAVLKMVNRKKSWSELISASHCIGLNRLQMSSVNEIFDSNFKYSLLNSKEERHFLFGPRYNFSYTAALVILYLEKISGFFPLDKDERSLAISAVGRLIVYLSLFSTMTPIGSSTMVAQTGQEKLDILENSGFFSFVGKLKKECNPNCLTVGLNKQIAVVALQPIKKGSEITIPYLGFWTENHEKRRLTKENRSMKMFSIYGLACNCMICNGDYELIKDIKMTESQKKNYDKLNIHQIIERFSPFTIAEAYAKLSKTLAFLNEIQFSTQYVLVLELFRKCLVVYQKALCENIILNYDR